MSLLTIRELHYPERPSLCVATVLTNESSEEGHFGRTDSYNGGLSGIVVAGEVREMIRSWIDFPMESMGFPATLGE